MTKSRGPAITRFVRFLTSNGPSWGVLEGDSIRRIKGDLYGKHEVASKPMKAAGVKLLAPVAPPKIFAVGLNYKSHLGSRPVTSIQNPGDPIVIPSNAKNVHYEAELVLVIGKKTSNASKKQARDAIFGVTCGNDVSERDWQHGNKKDLQWWRAKGADTFGPCGPVLVRGLNFEKLLLQGRLNGEIVQKQFTSDLLFDPATIVSYISRNVTLQPGDLVFTGTPGSTRKMKPGDFFEVELEGVGVLRNPVTGA
jgi:2-keto-4-pentenoate hydratase/2-oxohepta-3-ene-1,7-dioic acid hydratase in catechol pathway